MEVVSLDNLDRVVTLADFLPRFCSIVLDCSTYLAITYFGTTMVSLGASMEMMDRRLARPMAITLAARSRII